MLIFLLINAFAMSCRSEKLFVLLVQMGFLEALKSICISQKLDKVRSIHLHAGLLSYLSLLYCLSFCSTFFQDLKATAKECLLSAMASSAFVRDRCEMQLHYHLLSPMR